MKTASTFKTSLTFPARRGLTLIELLVSLAILSVIAVSVAGVFVIVLQSTAETQAQIEATGNARHALEQISTEIKSLETTPAWVLFVGTNNTLSYGDGIDNDGDGNVDEEAPDGLDDDGDWKPADDRHADLGGGIWERPGGLGLADWGDAKVDADFRFSSDTLRYHTQATTVTYDYDEISYQIGTHNGVDNVLIRTVTQWDGGTSTTVATSGLAYGVLSFNCLYWNSNAPDFNSQYWLETWDSTTITIPPNSFYLPAAIALEVTVHADAKPLDTVNLGNEKVKTMTLRTVVNVESVINDGSFSRRP